MWIPLITRHGLNPLPAYVLPEVLHDLRTVLAGWLVEYPVAYE